MPRAFFRLLFAAATLAASHPSVAQDAEWSKELAQRRRACDALSEQWRRTHDPQERARLRAELMHTAVLAERPGIVEEVAAGGRLAQKEIEVSQVARILSLRELKKFEEIRLTLADENHEVRKPDDPGWLVRRITRDAWEVWTPTHGWLFDGSGRLLNEARPARGDGKGRGWFGAFLPNGRWVTTDLQELDCALTFFSRDGQRVRRMTSQELVPADPQRALIGWARSDKNGAAWIVNVGSEQGYATVRVGPEGSVRTLQGIERWQLCHPRALGPRGWYLDLSVPDDAGESVLSRTSPGHGAFVGFPCYQLDAAVDYSLEGMHSGRSVLPEAADSAEGVRLPNGGDAFGFWPDGQDVFIGTEATGETGDRDAATTRKADTGEHWDERRGEFNELPLPVVDKTWFFTRQWQLRGWVRARRLADGAADGTMLLRMNDDSRIVTLKPDLGVAEVRHFLWPNVTTADAVTLFDDLRLGLFVRDGRLVLAGW